MIVRAIWSTLRATALAIGIGTVSVPAIASDDGGLQSFIEAHRCVVLETLYRIRSVEIKKRKPQSKNRFVILSPEAHISNFVQCIFFENDTKAICEAASGWYLSKPGEPRETMHTPDTIDALAKIGFDTGVAEGNFNLQTAARTDADVQSLVTLMLTSLFHGFGVREGMRLQIKAPLAKGHTSRCHPLS